MHVVPQRVREGVHFFLAFHPIGVWVKKWILDGWLTEGAQIATPSNIYKMFCRCHDCKRIWPHWQSNVTQEEMRVERRRRVTCKCGGIKLHPTYIPAWQSVYWFIFRGWLIRKVLLKKRVWDPRIPIMSKDLQ